MGRSGEEWAGGSRGEGEERRVGCGGGGFKFSHRPNPRSTHPLCRNEDTCKRQICADCWHKILSAYHSSCVDALHLLISRWLCDFV